MVTKRTDTGQQNLRNQTVQTLDLFWHGHLHGMEHSTSLPATGVVVRVDPNVLCWFARRI